MKQIIFILIFGVAFAQAQTPDAEKPKAKLLVSWQAKNCRACQTKTIDGQEFQIIADEYATVAFHGGAGADFLIGDIYVLNKTRRAANFDPERDVAVSAWTTAARSSGGSERLRSLTAEESRLKAPRPEFWLSAARALGDKNTVKKTETAEPLFLKSKTLAAGESLFGTIYLPKNDAHDAIGFNIAVGDRIYSFSFRNPKNNSPGAK